MKPKFVYIQQGVLLLGDWNFILHCILKDTFFKDRMGESDGFFFQPLNLDWDNTAGQWCVQLGTVNSGDTDTCAFFGAFVLFSSSGSARESLFKAVLVLVNVFLEPFWEAGGARCCERLHGSLTTLHGSRFSSKCRVRLASVPSCRRRPPPRLGRALENSSQMIKGRQRSGQHSARLKITKTKTKKNGRNDTDSVMSSSLTSTVRRQKPRCMTRPAVAFGA